LVLPFWEFEFGFGLGFGIRFAFLAVIGEGGLGFEISADVPRTLGDGSGQTLGDWFGILGIIMGERG